MQRKNKLIAFDQALNVSGYSIWEDGKLVRHGKFETDDRDLGVRLREIRSFLLNIIETENPDEIAIEEIQLQNIPGSTQHGNVETFKKLAYVQAVFLMTSAEKKIPCQLVSSSSWKSTCGVKGRARAEQKRNAQLFIENEFGVKAIQDIVDSICLGHHVLETKKKEVNWG